MKQDTNILEIQQLEYGDAILIAKKFGTTKNYVSNVLNRARSGKNLRGKLALKIIKHVRMMQES
ncbi:hypothetical protein SDC9_80219 [bioreactor metagenome]|jgi:hypothetical protein|uniref:Uncharacterized protein n=1 Tax=bioreactor metagenome TaxID=1076179 RepID=A0A644YYT7_9ZZZZ